MDQEIKIDLIKKELKDLEDQKKKEKGKGNISRFFGANPNEVDGDEFQRKARREWE